ncbi:ATP-binding protein [Paenibacillus amylolyticus]|uniref:ATP-binding protein n=1 Tax=Paenibacillus amylolyticus TaxID=1451 RepID=UPI00249B6DBE|nr:AAA family ATPase [Paenibacillus amylolyticus]WFA88036.1 AAA family ATPase [Paenibacillus amylolyticus]
MIRIKEFNTAYWGRIGTAATPYQFNEKVNAFVGASGSGKTTLMDALRIALGDAKFEYNRAMDHYINKVSNWSVVQVTFWNRQYEGQPFLTLGFKEAEITVCVRLDRSSGDCKREYYMFDGSFRDIVNLGQNPKAYQLNRVKYGEYLQKLEVAGLTFAFRKLMLMKPEDVQNVVGLDANRLFQLIFDIKGQKAVQNEHDLASEKLKEVKNLELQSSEDLASAKKTLAEYENKKSEFEANENRKVSQQNLKGIFLKKKYWDNKNELGRQQRMVLEEESKQRQLETTKSEIIDGLALLEKELETEERKEEEMRNQIQVIFEKVKERQTQHTKQEAECNGLNNIIKQIESIPYEDMNSLKSRLESTVTDLQVVNFEYKATEDKREIIVGKLDSLNQGYNPLPGWVGRFKNVLENEKIPYLMLAENISIKPKYEQWVTAIEAYLGRERYRIVTLPEYHLLAKKLQEIQEYGARVSQTRMSRQPINSKKLDGKFISLRNALDITNEEQIGGYLEYLNNVYLVENVEEGHQLSLNGFKSLTQKGLLQDQEGGLFLRVRELVCGSVAREKYKLQLEQELDVLTEKFELLKNEKNNLESVVEDFSLRINNQEKLLQLPQLYIEKEQQEKALFLFKCNLDEANKKYEDYNANRDIQNKLIKTLEKQQVQKEADIVAIQKEIDEVGRTINGYRGSIGNCRIDLKKSIFELEQMGYDEHSISFIEIEILSENLFVREDGSEWNLEILEKELRNISDQIESYERESDIDAGIIAMVEPQKRRVDVLTTTYELAKGDREQWENRLVLAELALKNHVQETMTQYIGEFKSMAELLGARAEGKFQQEGPSYLSWKIQIKIGFDGKELVNYDDPEFSSGQRAAISIMLLLAAVSNQKEGTKNSLMFLDEPTARVDDARANEIGTILQKSNVQYFITHQISESLKSIDWIDHAFITSKLRNGQKFAESPIYESRRK